MNLQPYVERGEFFFHLFVTVKAFTEQEKKEREKKEKQSRGVNRGKKERKKKGKKNRGGEETFEICNT